MSTAPQLPPQTLDHFPPPSDLSIYFVSYLYVYSGGRDRFAKGSVPPWDFPSSDFLFFAFCFVLRKPPSSFFCFFFLPFSFLLMYSIPSLSSHHTSLPHNATTLSTPCDFSSDSLSTCYLTSFSSVSVVVSLPCSLCPVSYYMHYLTDLLVSSV